VRQAIVPAGGLSGRRFQYATNFSGFAAGCLRNKKPKKYANCVIGLFDGGMNPAPPLDRCPGGAGFSPPFN
jgi:hypothetical protein